MAKPMSSLYPTGANHNRSGVKAPKTEAGFTLIELLVVLLIIAILLGIAIPIFLGTSGSANDRAAQSNLSNAILEIKNMYQAEQSYATIWLAAATLTTTAPEYAWEQEKPCTESSPTDCVSEYPVDVVSPDGGRGVILATLSKTGVCWYAADLEATPTTTKFTDKGGTAQFLAGTSKNKSPNDQEMNSAALTSSGIFYSKQTTTSCDASTPTVKGNAWSWGTSYASAPEK